MNEFLYETVIVEDAGSVIKRTDSEGNVLWIPIRPENSDYQEYLASLEPVKPAKK